MKTVIIPIFQGVEAKNILRTDIAKTLMALPEVRLLCLVKSPERAEYYRKEIPDGRILCEVRYRSPAGRLEGFFSFLKFHLIRTATTDLKRRRHYEESGRWLRFFAARAANWILARRLVRTVCRFLDYHLVRGECFADILEKYRPDAVFLAHLFDDAEIALLREARRRGIPAIGFINSWDKLTARCALRLLPDRLIVFNEIVKKEAEEHADMPPEKIIISGLPQYDRYINDPPSPKEEFFKKIGLDPQKHLVLYAPMGSKFSESDWDMIDFLHSRIGEGKAIPQAQFFVRFQPNDFIEKRELKKRPWLKYDLPGIRFSTRRGVDWDMSFAELRHLTDTLAHTAVLVGYASSMSVDAAIFGHPVININFELGGRRALSKSPTQFYRTEHYQKALASGGIRLVNSKNELLQWLNVYLTDPSRDRQGRKRLVRTQCWRLDGRAGERIAKAILDTADRNSPSSRQ